MKKSARALLAGVAALAFAQAASPAHAQQGQVSMEWINAGRTGTYDERLAAELGEVRTEIAAARAIKAYLLSPSARTRQHADETMALVKSEFPHALLNAPLRGTQAEQDGWIANPQRYDRVMTDVAEKEGRILEEFKHRGELALKKHFREAGRANGVPLPKAKPSQAKPPQYFKGWFRNGLRIKLGEGKPGPRPAS